MADNEDTLHFLDYWRVVTSRKEIVIAVFFLAVLTGSLWTFLMPRVYMASTRIAVREETLDVPVFQRSAIQIYNPFFMRTQFEIIQSRSILAEVVRNLKLDETLGRAYGYHDQPNREQVTIGLLSRSMKVHQYRDTNLIEIQMYLSRPEDQAPEYAARIANEVAQVFRDLRVERSRAETEQALDSLHEALLAQEKKVSEAEASLEKIRQQLKISQVVSPLVGPKGVLEKDTLRHLEAARLQALSEMQDKKVRIDQITKLSGDELLHTAAVLVQDPSLMTLRERLVESEVGLSNLLESYGDNHPDVRRLQAVISRLRAEVHSHLKGLKTGLEADYQAARMRYESLSAELNAAKDSDISSEADRYLPFTKAQEEVARLREIRDALEMRWLEERIELDIPRTTVEVIDPAQPPDKDDPVSPNMFLNLLVSIVVGLGLGIGLAYFVEYMDTSIKTVDDIERYIGSPVIGVIPQNVRPLIEEGSESPHAESYRVLRTNLQFSEKRREGKSFCITSGGIGEGKSLSIFNLAFVCARLGDHALIVDSDLRHPRQHRILNISSRVGLANVLAGEVALHDAILSTSVPNLDILTCGKLKSTHYGLLNTDAIRALSRETASRYDIVLFDAPPIVGISDASILARSVDGVMLVVQHRKYPRALSMRARNMVEGVGGNLIGVILNNINVTRDHYYYYHSYYSLYGRPYGYGHRRTDEKEDAAPPAEEKPDLF